MAKVETKYTNVEYVLTLTENEAKTLRVVLNTVGGLPDRTPRRFVNAVNDALRDAGVQPIEANFAEDASDLYFRP